MTNPFSRGMKSLLARIEPASEMAQFLLSIAAVILIVSNEFSLTRDFVVPWLDSSWPQLQVVMRTVTWAVFVSAFVLYGLASGNVSAYARKHWLSLVVCLTWFPYYGGTLFQSGHTLLSLEMFTLIGSIAHAWRVARWTVRRFSAHPVIVIGASALVLIVSSAALLTLVEPQTFPNMGEAAWFCVESVFTVGYGDIVPHTAAGRLVTTGIILAGAGLVAVFIGFVAKLVSQKLSLHEETHANEKVLAELAKNNAELAKNNELVSAVLAEQKRSNDLNAALIARLSDSTPEVTAERD